MNRKTDKHKRFPGYYRHDVLDKCRTDMGLSVLGVAKKIGANQDTATRVFRGTASQKKVWPFAKFFKLDWKQLHDLDLPLSEIHRAALNGNSRPVR